MCQQKSSKVVGREIGLDALSGEYQVAAGLGGVENQTVEARRTVQDLVREGPDLFHEREVCRPPFEIGIRYAAPDSLGRRVSAVRCTRPHQHPRSTFAELSRDGLADTAGRTSDEKRWPARQASGLISHRWLRFRPSRS